MIISKPSDIGCWGDEKGVVGEFWGMFMELPMEDFWSNWRLEGSFACFKIAEELSKHYQEETNPRVTLKGP